MKRSRRLRPFLFSLATITVTAALVFLAAVQSGRHAEAADPAATPPVVVPTFDPMTFAEFSATLSRRDAGDHLATLQRRLVGKQVRWAGYITGRTVRDKDGRDEFHYQLSVKPRGDSRGSVFSDRRLEVGDKVLVTGVVIYVGVSNAIVQASEIGVAEKR